jgi:hypothetical protein
LKPFLKYVYALHILTFLGYNQQVTRFCGSALNAAPGNTGGSSWYRSQTASTRRVEAILCIEELKRKTTMKSLRSPMKTQPVAFFNCLYNSTDGQAGNGVSIGTFTSTF